MLKIIGTIPRTHFHVAVSGGSDSMVLVDFLMKYPRNSFDIIHFNHGTDCCDEAESFVREFCTSNGIVLHVGKIEEDRKDGESRESFWRRNRYRFLEKFGDEPILMAHQLDDCIETWIMSCMEGNPKLIPYHNRRYNVYRPMLCVPKREIRRWAEYHGVKYVVDASNTDTTIKRNYVRHMMMEHVRHISPGIERHIMRLVIEASKCDM